MLPSNRIPLALKLAYTAFMAVLVPVYWRDYGPTNFLYFCDMALFFALGAVWLESPLLASMPAVGILLPQVLWCVDFIGRGVGLDMPGGLTSYMFNADRPLFLRGLSFFHFWLPFLLVYLVWRLGYDRRALVAWTVLAWFLQLVGYFLLPPGPAPEGSPDMPVNVNYVYGLGDDPQTWMPPGAFLALMMVALPLLLFLPTHFLLAWLAGPPRPCAGDKVTR
jgi:hypothetical protein